MMTTEETIKTPIYTIWKNFEYSKYYPLAIGIPKKEYLELSTFTQHTEM